MSELIIELSKDAKIKDACKKINYKDHEDLYQELFIILCELPAEKLQKIKDDGYLHYWIVRTLLNMTSPNGKFYKKYNIINDDTEADKRIAEPSEETEISELESERRKVESLLEQYEKQGRDGFGWYKVTLLKMYAEVGSCRKLSELTGISYKTISVDISNFRRELLTIINRSGS